MDVARIVVQSLYAYSNRSLGHRTGPGRHQAGGEPACPRSQSFCTFDSSDALMLVNLQYIYAGGFTSGSTAQCVSTLLNIPTHFLTCP